MSYHHKHDECARDTKDILSNILRASCGEYKLLGITDTLKSADDMRVFREDAKALECAEDQTLAEEQGTETTSLRQIDCTFNSMEQYYTIMNTRFEDIETEDAYSRVRKRGGYIESW